MVVIIIISLYIIMANRWISFVKTYASENNISYGCAISNPECRATYKSYVKFKLKPTKKKIKKKSK
jgi:hypothetical protein